MAELLLLRRKPRAVVFAALRRALIGAVICGAIVATAAGCASKPDPESTRADLSEVTEAPMAPEEIDEYDATLHPDPMVDAVDCTPYLVVTSRGTGEGASGQLLSPVVRMIAESRPDEVQTVDLDYPADAEVKIGATRGARILIDTLNVQADACPEQRFILLGYSQGALIVGDAIASPEVRLIGASVGELAPDAAERVLAVVLYGDPRFRGAESYDVGDFDPSVNGVLPRPAGSLDAFADRLRDYCVSGDIVCQSGFDLDESGHVAYYSNGMQQDGAAFVITRLGPPESAEDDAAPSKGRTPVGGAEPDESD